MDIIKYKEKEYPVKVGYYALKHTARKVKEKEGEKEMSMADVLSGDMEVYEPLLYYSLQMGAKTMGVELDLKMEDMEFMLDDCLSEFTKIVVNSFPNANELGK
jgi:hypothetical protein